MIHNYKHLPKLRPRIVQRVQTQYKSDNLLKSQVSQDSNPKIIISNQQKRYNLKYGKQFQQLLEARDQVMQHSFYFDIPFKVSEVNQSQEEIDEIMYQNIKKKVKEFLAESVSNVVSASFSFLCKGQLEEKQSMEFASKNIMLNVHSIFRQTIQGIEKSKIFKDPTKLQKLRSSLIIQVEQILQNILINLADSYPQAPPAGATPRMRQYVTELYRVDDQRNDFIYANGIKIKDYMPNNLPRKDEDYTEFIMTVINKIITVTQDNSEDARERTVYEKFTQFNEHIFWITQQKTYQQVLNRSEKNSKEGKETRISKLIQEGLGNHYEEILSNQNLQLREIHQKIVEFTQEIQKESAQIQSHLPQIMKKDQSNFQQIVKLWQSHQQGRQTIHKDKNYAIGQKISPNVKPFSRQQIADKQFTAKHSSILRILTKWAGYLQDIFKNAQQNVKQRLYAFKTIDDQFVSVPDDQYGSSLLIWRLKQEYKQVKGKFNALLKTSYQFIGKILGDSHEQMISSVNRYTETRQAASKINLALTSLMLSYTNILIHHLLKAGQMIWTSQNKFDHIDLVVFRVSDLMRSKLQCNERSFISLLKTMYMLDGSDKMQGKFRLVRIKNKLDEPANNIMINYLFMGKVQCQLQLSIQEPKGKAKNYYAFSHFVYQLTRGKFGSIAESAIMIAQLDPMIAACKNNYYQEKQVKVYMDSNDNKDIQEDNVQKSQWEKEIKPMEQITWKQTFFQCICCQKLITNEHINKFVAQQYTSHCYQCIVKKQKAQQCLKQDFKAPFEKIAEFRIGTYAKLAELKSQKYLVSLTASGEVTLSAVVYLPKWFATITVKIDNHVLNGMANKNFDFNSLDFSNLTKKVKKSSNKLKNLIYLFDSTAKIPQQILKMAHIDKSMLKKHIKHFISELKIFSLQKRMVQTLKHKVEIIKVSQQQWQILGSVCSALIPKQKDNQNSKNDEVSAIRYNRYKQIDLSNIRKIIVRNQQLEVLPNWLVKTTGLKHLDLSGNKLTVIEKDVFPQSIAALILNNNKINSIDLSNLLYLRELNLNNNKLTKIDFSYNTNLKKLEINNNQLQNIDLQNNSSLIEVNLEMNRIATLTIGENSKIQIVDAKNNVLTKCTLNGNRSIKKLIIYNNKIEQIDHLPQSMEILWADTSSQITKFDFQKIKKLKEIRVFGEETKRKEMSGLSKSVKFHSMIKTK